MHVNMAHTALQTFLSHLASFGATALWKALSLMSNSAFSTSTVAWYLERSGDVGSEGVDSELVRGASGGGGTNIPPF